MLVLTVRGVTAGRVELMGDFTEWQPVSLAPVGDGWTARMKVAPGARQVMLRIDGGEWKPPPNLSLTDDGFGGKVGLIVVP
jgi:hypothetical protein